MKEGTAIMLSSDDENSDYYDDPEEEEMENDLEENESDPEVISDNDNSDNEQMEGDSDLEEVQELSDNESSDDDGLSILRKCLKDRIHKRLKSSQSLRKHGMKKLKCAKM